MSPVPEAAQSSRDPRAELDGDLDVTLFVACYNEEKNIEATLDTVLAAVDAAGCSYEIIVIDDASSDRSVARVHAYQRAHAHRPIRLIVNPHNRGLGHNYIEGAFQGRGRYYRLVCGDDVEPAQTLIDVLGYIDKVGLVIPYHEECEGKSRSRRVLSRAFTLLVNLISGHRIRYYNGLALHRRYNVMRWHAGHQGFGFQADLITRVLSEGVDHVEIPVVQRHDGSSSALTPANLLSVAQLLVDLSIRRVGQVGHANRRPRLAAARVDDSPSADELGEGKARRGLS